MGATQSTSESATKKIDAAGLFFSNGVHVLGGLQKKKGQWIISGLGGKCEGTESLPQTAFRECLEELLGLYDLPTSLFNHLYIKHLPNIALFSENYVNYTYTFDQLESILLETHKFGIQSSPLYKEFPFTVQDLILKRLHNQGEVTVLTLLPAQPCRIAEEFQDDITKANKTA